MTISFPPRNRPGRRPRPGTGTYREWDGDGLDPDRLGAAWRHVVDRHAVLRTMVGPAGARWVIESPALPVPPVLDLRGLPVAEAHRRAALVRAAMVGRAPRVYPLWEVRLTLLPGRLLRVHVLLEPLVTAETGGHDVLVPELLARHGRTGAPPHQGRLPAVLDRVRDTTQEQSA